MNHRPSLDNTRKTSGNSRESTETGQKRSDNQGGISLEIFGKLSINDNVLIR